MVTTTKSSARASVSRVLGISGGNQSVQGKPFESFIDAKKAGLGSGGSGGSNQSKMNPDDSKRIEDARRKAEEEAARKRAEEEAARKKAEELAEINRKFEEYKAQKALEEARKQKDKLKGGGAPTRIDYKKEVGSGDTIKTTTTIDPRTGERVFERENVDTGEVTTKVFKRPPGGGLAKKTEEVKEIKVEEQKVITPTMQEVVLGKSLQEPQDPFKQKKSSSYQEKIIYRKKSGDIVVYERGQERKATAEEIKLITSEKPSSEVREFKKNVFTSPLTKQEIKSPAAAIIGAGRRTYSGYTKFQGNVAQRITVPIFEKVGKITGKSISDVKKESSFKSPLGQEIKSPQLAKVVIADELEDIKYRPVSYGTTFAVGAGIGAGVKSVKLAVKPSGRLVSKIPEGIKDVAKFGGKTALFAGATTLSALDIYAQPTAETRAIRTKDIVKEFSLFGKGYKEGARIVTPITITQPARQVVTPEARQIVRTKIINGKEIRETEFIIAGESRPPIRKITTTPLREYYYQRPEGEIIPAKKFIIRTTTPIKNTQPFETVKFGEEKKGIEFMEVAGSFEEINLKTKLGGLPKVDQFLIKSSSLAPEKLQAKVFGKKATTYIGQVDTQSTGLLRSLGSTGIERKVTLGKLTTKQRAFVVQNPLKETDELFATREELFFKDVSKPFSRARGKVQQLKVLSVEYKEPEIIGDIPDTILTGAKKSDINQVALSLFKQTPKKTASVQGLEQKEIQNVISAALKQTKPVKETATFTEIKPQTFTIKASPTLAEQKTKTTQTPALRIKELQVGKSKTRTILKSTTIPKTRERNLGRTVQRPMEKSILKEMNVEKLVQKPVQKNVQKQGLTPKQILKLQQKITSKPFAPVKVPTPRPTKEPTTVIPPLSIPKSSTTRGGELFNVFIRRGGKFKLIGKQLPRETALALGAGKTRRTLAATFKLEPLTGSKGVSAPKDFVMPKRKKDREQGFTFIEKRNLRLSTSSEVKEIQYAKSIKLPKVRL